MNGFETAALIRERDRTRHMPIIFLTAGGKTETEMFQGYAVGAIDYLLKPIRPAVLRSKVLVLMDLYRKTEEVNRLNEELHLKAGEFDALNLTFKNERENLKQVEEKLRLSEDFVKNLKADLEARVDEPAVAGEK
jgi:DNA-binding response OmpR family regulator